MTSNSEPKLLEENAGIMPRPDDTAAIDSLLSCFDFPDSDDKATLSQWLEAYTTPGAKLPFRLLVVGSSDQLIRYILTYVITPIQMYASGFKTQAGCTIMPDISRLTETLNVDQKWNYVYYLTNTEKPKIQQSVDSLKTVFLTTKHPNLLEFHAHLSQVSADNKFHITSNELLTQLQFELHRNSIFPAINTAMDLIRMMWIEKHDLEEQTKKLIKEFEEFKRMYNKRHGG